MTKYSVCKWRVEQERDENSKTWDGTISTYGMATAKMGSLSMGCAYKKVWCHMLKNVSKSLNNVRFQMWFNGENQSL